MKSVKEKKKQYQLFFYGLCLSLLIHAGAFGLLLRLNQRWGWISLNESLFEVSIVTQADNTVTNGAECEKPDLQADVLRNKTALKKCSLIKAQQVTPPVASQDSNPPKPEANHMPGEKDSADSDMAMISNLSPSNLGSGGGLDSENQGVRLNEQIGSGAGGSGDFGSRMNYLDMVRLKIENQKKYPHAAQQRNIEGQVTVEFAISLDGRISEPKVFRTSGNDSLDLAAIDAVKKASPFVSPPRQFFDDSIHINLPIRFELIR